MYTVYIIEGYGRVWYVGSCLRRNLHTRVLRRFSDKKLLLDYATHVTVHHIESKSAARELEKQIIKTRSPILNVARGGYRRRRTMPF